MSELKELGIKHVVVQAFDVEDKRPTGRVKSLQRMMPYLEKGNFESILVDTAVMNLPATAFSLMANHLIKKEFGLPVGFAPSNGTYMWRKAAPEEERDRFPAVDAAVHAISALLSDFLLYGPLTGTSRVFPAVAAAASMMAAGAFADSSALPLGESSAEPALPRGGQTISRRGRENKVSYERKRCRITHRPLPVFRRGVERGDAETVRWNCEPGFGERWFVALAPSVQNFTRRVAGLPEWAPLSIPAKTFPCASSAA